MVEKIRCGIEIHQQLNTRKLFCNCPSVIRDDSPDFHIERKIRAVVGETGEIDKAAAQEQAKSKTFVYQGYNDTTCLVELDEEPPGVMNDEALKVAAQVAKMLDAELIDEVQVMRKTVVDGSNTTGFQRTALIARNGKLETSQGVVRIPSICLEEDACKIIERKKECDIYNLSRLGIPLVEIATEPDIVSGEHAKETAELIGMYLRSTGKVKRGLGTIRQDLNVSIKEGARIEIKGAQDLRMIPKWVENEAKRQNGLVEVKNKIKEKLDGFEVIDVSKAFEESKCKFLKNKFVAGIKIDGFEGVLGKELLPNYRVGSELADRAKVAGFGGIIHSDENLDKYPIGGNEKDIIVNKLSIMKKDAFVLAAGNKENVIDLFENHIIPRVKQLKKGVLQEVRKANDDGSTSYLRPMPGAARMYPETDTIPVKINEENIELPELLKDKVERFKRDHKLGEDLANESVKKGYDFDHFVNNYQEVKPAFIAETLVSVPKTIKRKYNIDIEPTQEQLDELFVHLDKAIISSDSVVDILKQINERPIQEILKDFEMIDDKELEQRLKEIVTANKNTPFNGLIGIAMKELRGKASGKKISEILKKLV